MLRSENETSLLCRLAVFLACAVALIGVAACGGGDDDDGGGSPEETVKAFANALADADGDKACDQLTKNVRGQIEATGAKCGEQLGSLAGAASSDEKNKLKEIDPEVSVDGDNATAKVPNIGGEGTSDIKLKKEDGDWKIDLEQAQQE